MNSESAETGNWWSRRRLRYNVALVGAGVIAFVAYASVVQTRCLPDPEVDTTLVTIAIQAFLYLIAMAIANVFYNLGGWLEGWLRPVDLGAYRRWAWGLGLGLSVALPFTIPVAVAISRCRPL
jgi:hypothetical protein